MDFLKASASDYNYYPNTSIALCVISYEDIGDITTSVADQTNLQVVWGPQQLTNSITGIAYSLMFVAQNTASGEYFVVIRGTNPLSIVSWLEEDFDLAPTPNFNTLPGNPPDVPADALISQGTWNGTNDLISMTDPTSGLSVVEFLSAAKPKNVFVTGHSLGGTLTPVMFAYLNGMLYGGGQVSNMAMWSFAGLTPGGTGFNAYLNSIIPNDQGFQWRFQNSLDIAPHMFADETAIQNIYAPYDLDWSDLEKVPLDDLFGVAEGTGIGYSQPQPGLVMPGTFDTSIPDEDLWSAQALHQHHATTYQSMVAAQFPADIGDDLCQRSSEPFLAYWLGYATGNTLQQTPESVGTVALAFGVTAPGNTIITDFLTKKHSKEEILAGVRFLQARGQKVVMSISGNPNWPGHPHGWEDLDPATFAANAKTVVVDEWGLDGIDLDNEAAYNPTPAADGNFVETIKALRKAFGADKTISLPVYKGTVRDAYLQYVKDEIDYVYTMAYWNSYDEQISLLESYQGLVGDNKAGIGVAEAANSGQNTPFDIVPKLAQYTPKAGMMLWTLNSTEAANWCKAISDNLPDRAPSKPEYGNVDPAHLQTGPDHPVS